MASRLFASLTRRQLLVSGAAVGGVGLATASLRGGDDTVGETAAQIQFNTSSIHVAPAGFAPWQIRNDYPTSEILKARNKSASATSELPMPTIPSPGPAPGLGDDFEGANAPWLKIDFEKEHERYAEAIRRYCFDGMVEAKFRPQDNTARDWYHAPWMHYRDPNSMCTEREPVNGFTFERATPKYEFANTQDVALQNWACGFYNATGATVFGDMWKNPNNPDFSTDKHFPVGTCAFKILLNNATNGQLPMEGSPTMYGCISKTTKNGKERNAFASPLRLIQVDFAVVDDRSPIGWVFGTFMYDKSLTNKEPWEKLTLVGLQWGNDPWLTQEVYDKDPKKPPPKPRQSWLNPAAEKIRVKLKGSRPSWGWNGRMNGPADNFISACASCHSTSTRDHMKNYGMTPPIDPTTRAPKPPNTDANVMNWFRDVPAGQTFDQGLDPKNPSVYEPENPKLASKTKSCDYSLQMQMGYANYSKWKQDQESILQSVIRGTKMVISDQPDPANIAQRDHLRQGPDVQYEKKE